MTVNAIRRKARHPDPSALGYVMLSSKQLKEGRVQWSIPPLVDKDRERIGAPGGNPYLVWAKTKKRYVVHYSIPSGEPGPGWAPGRAIRQFNRIADARLFFEDQMREAAIHLAFEVLTK